MFVCIVSVFVCIFVFMFKCVFSELYMYMYMCACVYFLVEVYMKMCLECLCFVEVTLMFIHVCFCWYEGKRTFFISSLFFPNVFLTKIMTYCKT